MFDSISIVQLFQNVMVTDMKRYDIPEEAVQIGIESMALVYKPNTSSLNSDRSVVADYNDVAHRCAYLHKYAAFHTAMVQDLLYEAIAVDFNFYGKCVFSENYFKICSIGGGPGSDVIGALSALHSAFGFFRTSVTVVDYMYNWSYSFDSILRELGSGYYGSFGNCFCDINWSYVPANLLKKLTLEVQDALSDAKLVTMIKFVSAAACLDTEFMLKNIFEAMRPGAMVLFIDNDGGGFHKVFMETAIEYKFVSVYGPLFHQTYSNEFMKKKAFGYQSCYKTTVTVHIIQKPDFNSPYVNYDPSPYVGNPTILPSPFVESPLTPIIFNPNKEYFTRDIDITDDNFVSPISEIPQSPQNHNFETRQATATPCNRKKNKRMGCFPISRFRHHLAAKVDQMKSRARAVFKKKNKKKNHPIFKL